MRYLPHILLLLAIVGLAYLIFFYHRNESFRQGPKKGKSTSLILGGWCQCSYDNTSTWGSSANTICPGGFQTDPAIPPKNPKSNDQYDNIWLTLGGDNVGAGKDCSLPDFVKNLLTNGETGKIITGICFDTEGCMAKQPSEIRGLVEQYRKKEWSKGFKYVYTPLGDAPPQQIITTIPYSEYEHVFDYIAPMFYWGETTYDSVDLGRIKEWIKHWGPDGGAGWPKSKTIITFQSASAATHQNDILKPLAKLVVDEGYAGMLGWPSEKNKDTINVDFIYDVFQGHTPSPPAPSPPTPSPPTPPPPSPPTPSPPTPPPPSPPPSPPTPSPPTPPPPSPPPSPPTPSPPTPSPPSPPTPPPGGDCNNCAGISHGPCQASTEVCYSYTPGTHNCPPNTDPYFPAVGESALGQVSGEEGDLSGLSPHPFPEVTTTVTYDGETQTYQCGPP